MDFAPKKPACKKPSYLRKATVCFLKKWPQTKCSCSLAQFFMLFCVVTCILFSMVITTITALQWSTSKVMWGGEKWLDWTQVPFFLKSLNVYIIFFCWPTPMRNTKQVDWNLPDDTATVLSLDDPLQSLLLPPPPPLLPAKGQVFSLTLFYYFGFIQSTIK